MQSSPQTTNLIPHINIFQCYLLFVLNQSVFEIFQVPTPNQNLNLSADQSGKMSWEMSEQVVRDLGRQLKYKKNFILYKEDTFYMTDEEAEVFFGKLEPGPAVSYSI